MTLIFKDLAEINVEEKRKTTKENNNGSSGGCWEKRVELFSVLELREKKLTFMIVSLHESRIILDYNWVHHHVTSTLKCTRNI